MSEFLGIDYKSRTEMCFKKHVLILTRLKTCFERIIAFRRIDFTERYDRSSHREASFPYKLEKRFKNEYAI